MGKAWIRLGNISLVLDGYRARAIVRLDTCLGFVMAIAKVRRVLGFD